MNDDVDSQWRRSWHLYFGEQAYVLPSPGSTYRIHICGLRRHLINYAVARFKLGDDESAAVSVPSGTLIHLRSVLGFGNRWSRCGALILFIVFETANSLHISWRRWISQ